MGGEWVGGFGYEAVPPWRNQRNELPTTHRQAREACVANFFLRRDRVRASSGTDAAAESGPAAVVSNRALGTAISPGASPKRWRRTVRCTQWTWLPMASAISKNGRTRKACTTS